jgi:hypothetical protein
MTTVDVARRIPPSTHDFGVALKQLLIDEGYAECLATRVAEHVENGAPNVYILVKDIKDDGTFMKNPALMMALMDHLEQMTRDAESWNPAQLCHDHRNAELAERVRVHPVLDRARWRLDLLVHRLTS